jgi:hypothetical protein
MLKKEIANLPTPKTLEEAIGQIKWLKDDLQFNFWPDGCLDREEWLMHVSHFIPLSIWSDAAIRASEDRGPHYLPFLEPPGWKPKADFTCWICGKKTPHPHPQAEIDAARTTLDLFKKNVWDNLCKPRSGT